MEEEIYYYEDLELMETEYSYFLLDKYLTKHYGQDIAQEMLSECSDMDKLAKSFGREDIGFFCEYFMRNIFVPSTGNAARQLSQAHYELWDILNDMFVKDLFDKLNAVDPRGFAKTTMCDLAVIVWCVCYKESIFTILIAKKDSDATEFTEEIKTVFEKNQMIIDNFGLLIKRNDKKYIVNSNEVQFTNGTCLQAVGSGTSIRGRKFHNIRPTLVIGDDAQDDNDILTDEAREKKYDIWCKQVDNVGDTAVYRHGKKIKKATKIISIGTVLHLDCLISRLSRNLQYKTILKRAIILEEGQTVDDIFESPLWQQCHDIYFDSKLTKDQRREKAEQFYNDHFEEMQFPVLWPEKWDCFRDLATEYWDNRKTFMSEKMNDATSIGEKWFKSVSTQTSDEIEAHKFLKTMLSVDPASTTNKKSDSTSIIVGSKADNDFLYIRDIVHRKLTFNQYCSAVVKKLKSFKDITHINIEKNTYQGADVIKIKELISKEPELKGRKFEFINEMQRKNKEEKISTVIDPMRNGQIVIADDLEDSEVAIEEMMDYQGEAYTKHDDFIDNVAELYNKIATVKAIRKIKVMDRSKLNI